MFRYYHGEDISCMGKSFLAFLLAILIGVTMAETQISNLMQYRDVGRAFFLSQEKGRYSLELLGNSYQYSYLYPVGKMYNTEKELVVELNQVKVILPLRVFIDYSAMSVITAQQKKKMVDEGIKAKEFLEYSLGMLAKKIAISL